MVCSQNLSENETYDREVIYKYTYHTADFKELRRRHIQRIIEQDEVFPDDLPDDPVARCGYLFLNTDYFYKPFGKKDPMTPACILHDSLYDKELNGGITRLQADRLFLKAMLVIAGDNKWLQRQAAVYYSIVRSVGWVVW